MATPGCWRFSGWSSREPTAPASVDLAKQFRGDRHVSGRQKTRFQERFLARSGDRRFGTGDFRTFADRAFGAQHACRASHATLAVVAFHGARQRPCGVKARWGASDHTGTRARSSRDTGTDYRRRIGVAAGSSGKDRAADQGKVVFEDATSAYATVSFRGASETSEPGISRFRARCFASPRNDGSSGWSMSITVKRPRCRLYSLDCCRPLSHNVRL
jgi:hypothetical protein